MVTFSWLHVSLILSGLLSPITLAAPSTDTVLTPLGERPVGQVHTVPEGGQVVHVGDEIHLIDAAGKLVHVANNDGTRARGAPVGDAKTGWVAYAYWSNNGSSPISSFTTTWNVPPVPRTNHGQTVFLFNSIEPATKKAILQPVLQYGPSAAGGGAYWTVASWYIVGNHIYHTAAPKRVSTGKSLRGVITLTGHSGTKYNYVTSFSNVAGTTLRVTGSDQLVWATETLEAYKVTSASDYPHGSTVFSSINLKTSRGTPRVHWNTISDPADHLITTVNTQGAVNAKVTIKYPS